MAFPIKPLSKRPKPLPPPTVSRLPVSTADTTESNIDEVDPSVDENGEGAVPTDTDQSPMVELAESLSPEEGEELLAILKTKYETGSSAELPGEVDITDMLPKSEDGED